MCATDCDVIVLVPLSKANQPSEPPTQSDPPCARSVVCGVVSISLVIACARVCVYRDKSARALSHTFARLRIDFAIRIRALRIVSEYIYGSSRACVCVCARLCFIRCGGVWASSSRVHVCIPQSECAESVNVCVIGVSWRRKKTVPQTHTH